MRPWSSIALPQRGHRRLSGVSPLQTGQFHPIVYSSSFIPAAEDGRKDQVGKQDEKGQNPRKPTVLDVDSPGPGAGDDGDRDEQGEGDESSVIQNGRPFSSGAHGSLLLPSVGSFLLSFFPDPFFHAKKSLCAVREGFFDSIFRYKRSKRPRHCLRHPGLTPDSCWNCGRAEAALRDRCTAWRC